MTIYFNYGGATVSPTMKALLSECASEQRAGTKTATPLMTVARAGRQIGAEPKRKPQK